MQNLAHDRAQHNDHQIGSRMDMAGHVVPSSTGRSVPGDSGNAIHAQDCAYPGQEEDSAEDVVRFNLHDLCDEATGKDDVAWRNALQLISNDPTIALQAEPNGQCTPLHICCLNDGACPEWMFEALLLAAPSSAERQDAGGRLPLHLCAATHASVAVLQKLVEEYPEGLTHQDHFGLTPLHLLLKNDSIVLTLHHVRIMLGDTIPSSTTAADQQNTRFLFRRGDHHTWTLDQLNEMASPKSVDRECPLPTGSHSSYPADVQRALHHIQVHSRRQLRKRNSSRELNGSESPSHRSINNPASVATMSQSMLPLHLWVQRRRRMAQFFSAGQIDAAEGSHALSCLQALVAAFPHGLVCRESVRCMTPVLLALHPDKDHGEGISATFELSPEELHILLQNGASRVADVLTDSLPIHILAEFMPWNEAMLEVAVLADPQTVSIADGRGRLPIHLCISNHGETVVSEKTMWRLYHSRLANHADQDGRTPLDYVYLTRGCTMQVRYQSTFYCQIFHDASFGKGGAIQKSCRDKVEYLSLLADLPAWLRRHASVSESMQQALIERFLASPVVTCCCILQGCLWLARVFLFVYWLHSLSTTRDDQHETETVAESLAIALYSLLSLQLICQFFIWISLACMHEWMRLCISNFWRWVDLLAPTVALATVVQGENALEEDEDGSRSTVFRWAIISTAFLVLEGVSYFGQWWLSARIFIGTINYVLKLLLVPLAFVGLLVVGAVQMWYTVAVIQREDSCPFVAQATSEQDCNITVSWQESWIALYNLVFMQPLVPYGDTADSSAEISAPGHVLLAAFVATALVCIGFAIAAFIFLDLIHSADRRQLYASVFWEFQLISCLFWTSLCPRLINFSSGDSDDITFKRSLWQILGDSLFGCERNRNRLRSDISWHWLSRRFEQLQERQSTRALLFIAALLVMPIWTLLGLCTFGLLWPPQVREWIFSPSISSVGSSSEELESPMTLVGLHRELQRMNIENSNRHDVVVECIAEINSKL